MANPKYRFRANIYKLGINFCADVPGNITDNLKKDKGYIRVKGTVNGFAFTKSLVPVKHGPYRLFVNMITLKGAHANVGDEANFVIEQDKPKRRQEYPMTSDLKVALQKNHLTKQFEGLTIARKRDVLKYLNQVKTQETIDRNVNKVIKQLQQKIQNVRIP